MLKYFTPYNNEHSQLRVTRQRFKTIQIDGSQENLNKEVHKILF